MIKAEYIEEARNYLHENWTESAYAVIKACEELDRQEMSMKEFLDHCTACGGNWGGMFLTGIKRLFPAVYDAIPDDMGCQAFGCILHTMLLCGVDTAGE